MQGRRTYQVSAAAWPSHSGDPFSDWINRVQKYVVSNTLSEKDITWNPTTIIRGDDFTKMVSDSSDGVPLHYATRLNPLTWKKKDDTKLSQDKHQDSRPAMNNSWQIGWETIGAIVAIIGLLISIILEWDRLKASKAIPNGVFFVFMMGGGYGIGYAISQTQLWWRISSLLLGAIVGAFFGATFTNEDYNRGLLAAHLIAVVAGVTIGLWLTNRI